MRIYSVLDVKSKVFGKPFPESNSVNAIRGFEIAVNEGDSLMRRYPDDFALMELGEFDVFTGKLDLHVAPVNLATGRSLFRSDASGSAKV